jgi:signal transduction histidine kinase
VSEQRRQEFYDIMLADGDRLLHTVEQVLHAGRAAQKKRALNLSVVNLDQLVRECVELARLRHGLDAEAIRYVETQGSADTGVPGDREELRTAVSNLLDNAVKYSDNGVNIEVEVAPLDERFVVVRVKDSGIGIHRNQLKRIFKRFYRVPGHFMARFKGTGLGLFIVRSIVERHGGRVYAESEGLGRGSTFIIQLPRASKS